MSGTAHRIIIFCRFCSETGRRSRLSPSRRNVHPEGRGSFPAMNGTAHHIDIFRRFCSETGRRSCLSPSRRNLHPEGRGSFPAMNGTARRIDIFRRFDSETGRRSRLSPSRDYCGSGPAGYRNLICQILPLIIRKDESDRPAPGARAGGWRRR